MTFSTFPVKITIDWSQIEGVPIELDGQTNWETDLYNLPSSFPSSWDDIADKPASFPPETHSHPEYALEVHTHDYGICSFDQFGIKFENNKHGITTNDARGNFNIRVGNNTFVDGTNNEIITEGGFGNPNLAYPFQTEWSQYRGWIRWNIGKKGAVGDVVFNPGGACNVTSLAMCLKYLGVKRKTDSGQFEDELYQYAENNGYSRHSPYDLSQIARDYGVDSRFDIEGDIESIKRWIDGGNPNIIHGYFTDFGHIIVVVGYDDKGVIVHDPYGEWFASGYRTDLSGAYLHYSYNLIRRVCMPDGNLWTHYLKRKNS